MSRGLSKRGLRLGQPRNSFQRSPLRIYSQAGNDALNSERAPILKYAVKEILAGPRGIAKSSHLWLPLLLILSSDPGLDLKEAFSRSLFLILAVVCKVQFSLQMNDLSDREEDKAAGKQRWTEHLSYPFSLALAIAFIAVGLGTAAFAGRSHAATLAYMASTLLGLLYSLRPVRFKERGIWGLIVYALSATIIFVVVPWAWFDSSLFMLFILFCVVFSDKWIQIHFHQIVDYENDRECGTKTFVVQNGLKRAQSTLQVAAFLASFFMASLLFYLLFLSKLATIQQIVLLACTAGILAASGIYAQIIKRTSAA